MELPEHQRLGKYRIVRELGRGGMGVVYLAEDTTLGREVAIKMVRPHLALERRSIEGFMQEAKAVAALEHPHIVHINSFGDYEGALLIEMPYLTGGSLRERVRQGLSYGGLARALGEVLQALDCCHQRGIVHRDVKPGNILFDGKLNAKLSDFGAAVLLDDEWAEATRSGGSLAFVGTPQYACPEAWDNEPPKPSWDLYALGIVAREALTGEAVYCADTPLAYLRDLVGKQLVPIREELPAISEEFGCLIDDLHARDPISRPLSASEALARLSQTIEFRESANEESPTAGVQLPRPPSSRKLGRSKAKNGRGLPKIPSWLLPLGIAAIVVLAAGLMQGLRSEVLPGESPPQRVEPRSRTQEEAFRSSLPTVEQLHSLLRDPHLGASGMYAMRGSRDPESSSHVLVRRAIGSDPASIVGMLGGYFTVLSMQPGEETQMDVSGMWGTYGDDAGRHLVYGNVHGVAEWNGDLTEAFWMKLDYTDEMDPVEWSESVLAIPSESGMTDTALVMDWETDPKAMPFFWKELWYRSPNEMRPARNYLPAITGATARMVQASTPLIIDGVLDEPYWQLNNDNYLPAQPRNSDAALRAVQFERSTVIGLNWAGTSVPDPVLTIALMPFYHVPAQDSPFLRIEADGSDYHARWIAGDIQTSMADGWSIKVNEAAGAAELRIDGEALKRSASPLPGEVYRINAQLRDRASDEVLLCWGWPELNQVWHGAVLRFGT